MALVKLQLVMIIVLIHQIVYNVNIMTENKFIVCVTGGLGSGKSTVVSMLEELGAIVINADKVSHGVMNEQSTIDDLDDVIGGDIYTWDGSAIDRKKLGSMVFADPEAMQLLEDYMIPRIHTKIAELISLNDGLIVIEVPPTKRVTSFISKSDYVVYVDSGDDLRIARAMARDKRTIEQCKEIIAAQKTKTELNHFINYTLDNSGGLLALCDKVRCLHHTLIGKV